MYRYTTADSARIQAFRRDPATVLAYGTIAAYAFWLYAFGPALALLQSELHFSYAMVGLYSALWSGGAILVGVSFAAFTRRVSRPALLWSSAAAASAGAGLFALAHGIAPTLAGAGLLGFAGTTLLTCSQAILSDRHGGHRDRALTEANLGAAGCAVLAPLVLGLLRNTPAGWQVTMALPVLALGALFLRRRHQPLPVAAARPTARSRARLTRSCWLLTALVATGMAAEFCLVFFGAQLLAGTGLDTAQAATAMSAFYLGLLAGRAGGAWLTRRTGRTVPLLWASLAVTAAGFLLCWLASAPAPAVIGLFASGLGVANLYPLSLALALEAAPGLGDAVNAVTQLLGGALVVAAPYLLGILGDQLSLRAAFTIEPALIGISALLLVTGLKAGRPARPPA